MTLVIMAAGMGSRFGGLKQLEPVGPNGEFIIDYSVYDAIKAGFKKIVFIIKEENYEIFKETIGKRIGSKINVEYVFQDLKNIPSFVSLPSDRVKPLGTAQALYCCKDVVSEPFAVISSDDFYGYEPFKLLHDSLEKGEFSTIGYKIGNTLTDNGSVKRGVFYSKDNYVTRIIESKVEKKDGKIICTPLNGEAEYEIKEDQSVSMLMFGLQPSIFDYLNKDIINFFKDNKDDLSTCEYYLPDVITSMIKDGTKVKLINTKAVWKGITYHDDLDDLKNYIKSLIDNGTYPNKLY